MLIFPCIHLSEFLTVLFNKKLFQSWIKKTCYSFRKTKFPLPFKAIKQLWKEKHAHRKIYTTLLLPIKLKEDSDVAKCRQQLSFFLTNKKYYTVQGFLNDKFAI